ncbi:DUF4189 domain-containing protein [Roseococcus sp. SYP-B2431]|uniref:DUF4189 domain-containing protein n=1 Tax=Roseococcus sp. SYP-B2431 TaxID=2496640 RepID=UPI00103BF841|nr:DUF4189 domain-containing protein [Roseococcus sp. SYP-B2431]TCH97393.1 DUF4189 domain-containing protein [Roseococcus sp. SYP-B2431]
MKLVAVLVGVFFVVALTIPLGSPGPGDNCGTSCIRAVPQARATGVVQSVAFAQPLAAPSPATPAPSAVRYGAFSLARPPSFRYGVAVGQRERRAAQEAAEASCRSSPRGCSRIVEFTDACIAVTEGIKRVALFITSDPRTYEVRGIDYGTASNPADAQQAAMRDCQARERGALNCRVVQTLCAGR